MPAWLDIRHVHVPVVVFNPSGSHVDFLRDIGLVVLVTPVIGTHEPTSLGIVVGVDLPSGSFEARMIDILDGTDNRRRHI